MPLDGKLGFDDVYRFAEQVGRVLVERDPEHLTQEFIKVDRGSRIFIDTGRNGYSATFAAAYAVRARAGAPVSAPCTWEELEHGKVSPQTFNVRNMTARIADAGDLRSGMSRRRRSLKRAIEKLGKSVEQQQPARSWRRFRSDRENAASNEKE